MSYFNSFKGIPRNIWLLTIASFINRVGSMAISYLVLYMTNRIGTSMSDAGIVLAAYGIGALISNPISGKLSDKIGAMLLVKLSMIGMGIMLFIYPFFSNFYAILVVTIFWAMIGEAFRPATLSFIAASVPKESLTRAYALNRLAVNLGMGIGPLIGGFLSEIDYSLIFYVDGSMAFLSGIYLLIIKWDKPNFEKSTADVEKEYKGKFYKDKRLLIYLVALFPVVLVIFQFFSAMPLFIVEELGFRNSVFGTLVSINTAIIVLMEVPLNDKISKYDLRKILAIGAFLISLGFGGMALAETFYALVITVVIWTFGEMIIFPVSSTYMAEIAPQNRRGEYMGYYSMLFSIAFSVAPWMGTEIFETFGSQILWIGAFGVGIISSILFYNIKNPLKNS